MEKYHFVRQIGRGSYGEVWLVRCSNTRKKYVLKRIDLHRASKHEQKAAHQEAKLLSTIKHPNIVSYLDSFYNSEGSLFIVMGYCECGDLYTFIRNQNGLHFQEEEVIDWFVQICMALKYLHDRNILHRDLKTQNIFLTKNKLIKVGDLGIARILNGKQDMATTLVGTPYYMSPEIFSGKPYNQKSDVWALGCCIYETATLKHAFNAHDLFSLMQKVMKRKIPVGSEHYSAEFWNIVSSMLNHDPKKRPSMTDILLNDFIRKHILLFLQDTTKRTKSAVNVTSKDALDACSQASKPVSTLPRFQNIMMNHSKTQLQYKNENVKKSVTKIPDINGNGDGNDNSQQRFVKFKDSISHENEMKHVDIEKIITVQNSSKCDGKETALSSMANMKSSSHSSNLNNSFKENMNPTMKRPQCTNAFTFSQFGNNSKSRLERSPHSSTASSEEYNNSVNSFKLLKNLTYTIKNTRFNYRDNFDIVSNSPKSAQGLIWHSEDFNHLNKRQAASASGNLECLESMNIACNSLSGASILPKAHCSEKPKLSDNDFNVIAPYNSCEESNCNDYIEVEFGTRLELPPKDLSRHSIDKKLLQEIMDCNMTAKTSHVTNSAARQRRRELLKHETNTEFVNSKPIGVECVCLRSVVQIS